MDDFVQLCLTWLTLTVPVHLVVVGQTTGASVILPELLVCYSVFPSFKFHLCGHRLTVVNITINYV